MRYFVTGATGLVGTHVVEQLVANGHDVITLTRSRSNANHLPEAVTVVEGDITNKESLREPMTGVDGVFHIAAWFFVGPGPRNVERAERINVEGTHNVLELIDTEGGRPRPSQRSRCPSRTSADQIQDRRSGRGRAVYARRVVVGWTAVRRRTAGLYYGVPIIGDADPRFDPEGTFDLIDRYGVSIVGPPATVYRALMQVPEPSERYDPSSLRVVFNGGEALGQTIIDWFYSTTGDVAVHEVYGQTEAVTGAGDCEALGIDHESGYMGKPVPGQEVQVVDPETMEPIGRGDIGELALEYEGNPGCFVEYWNEPERTARKVREGCSSPKTWVRSLPTATSPFTVGKTT
jgi:hypothetical protein